MASVSAVKNKRVHQLSRWIARGYLDDGGYRKYPRVVVEENLRQSTWTYYH